MRVIFAALKEEREGREWLRERVRVFWSSFADVSVFVDLWSIRCLGKVIISGVF